MAPFVAGSLGAPELAIKAYIDELTGDYLLERALRAKLSTRSDREPEPYYGRRIAWYALVRSHKPALVVESGVHDGLGSSILLRALQRNSLEGAPGRLLGIDVDRNAGWLIPAWLRDDMEIQISDSLSALTNMDAPVDIFIHDSDHRYQYELSEYCAVEPYLRASALLVSDNARWGRALADFSQMRRRRFSVWVERTVNSIYPGAGLGLSTP